MTEYEQVTRVIPPVVYHSSLPEPLTPAGALIDMLEAGWLVDRQREMYHWIGASGFCYLCATGLTLRVGSTGTSYSLIRRLKLIIEACQAGGAL